MEPDLERRAREAFARARGSRLSDDEWTAVRPMFERMASEDLDRSLDHLEAASQGRASASDVADHGSGSGIDWGNAFNLLLFVVFVVLPVVGAWIGGVFTPGSDAATEFGFGWFAIAWVSIVTAALAVIARATSREWVRSEWVIFFVLFSPLWLWRADPEPEPWVAFAGLVAAFVCAESLVGLASRVRSEHSAMLAVLLVVYLVACTYLVVDGLLPSGAQASTRGTYELVVDLFVVLPFVVVWTGFRPLRWLIARIGAWAND